MIRGRWPRKNFVLASRFHMGEKVKAFSRINMPNGLLLQTAIIKDACLVPGILTVWDR